ncbi:MAG: G1 family glutamic endopeptidase [Rhabdochlamydiaceae bacterium]
MKSNLRPAVVLFALGVLTFSTLTAIPFAYAYTSSPFISNGPGPISLSQSDLASENWGGYAAASGVTPTASVTAVYGSWVVQTASSTAGATYSSQWIGIGGFFPHDTSLIQTGTESDYSGHNAHYSAWFELLPATSKTIATMKVSPGDVISASLVCVTACSSIRQNWMITISDVSANTQFSKTVVYKSSEFSAEWIDERPEVCTLHGCHLSNLASFGTANYGTDFTSISNTNYATIGVVTGPIGTFTHASITMVTPKGATLATPSELSSDGTSFTMARS